MLVGMFLFIVSEHFFNIELYFTQKNTDFFLLLLKEAWEIITRVIWWNSSFMFSIKSGKIDTVLQMKNMPH